MVIRDRDQPDAVNMPDDMTAQSFGVRAPETSRQRSCVIEVGGSRAGLSKTAARPAGVWIAISKCVHAAGKRHIL